MTAKNTPTSPAPGITPAPPALRAPNPVLSEKWRTYVLGVAIGCVLAVPLLIFAMKDRRANPRPTLYNQLNQPAGAASSPHTAPPAPPSPRSSPSSP